ncbi:hypothetical protein K239x_26980 [Planctomycetes bacterium K23_9]|uniref:Uncharacterized protein n=1 Tax=Stieleria marina TaxID=1930275 RepID=A0A517NUE6_9BACT|nr:hypothetical protein K239x_26980 [Planctomycetes bacterium K23_9]
MLLQGSLEPLLSSEGSSVESLSLGRSEPSLLSDALSLGRSEPSPLSLGLSDCDVESLLSDGVSLSLPDESPTLGSSLSLGRSLSEPWEPESLADRDVDSEPEPLDDVGTLVESSLCESLPESDVLVDRESESDPLMLPDVDPLSLTLVDWESDELPDESLDADDEPLELEELLTLGRLVDVLESLESLLPDESLD